MYRWDTVEANPVLPTNLPVNLWILAFATYGIGDFLTTIIGLSTGHLVEVSPIVIPVMERFGLAAMVGLKAAVFGITGLIWWYTPYPDSLGVPIGLSVMGILVTVWNTYLIMSVGL